MIIDDKWMIRLTIKPLQEDIKILSIKNRYFHDFTRKIIVQFLVNAINNCATIYVKCIEIKILKRVLLKEIKKIIRITFFPVILNTDAIEF